MDTSNIIGLIACDPKGIIGKNGTLPWSYPEELAHFRRTTYEQIMIMGSRTFESIPQEILKDRLNIVFTRKYKKTFWMSETVVFIPSLDSFLALKDLPTQKNIYMIGGAQIATLFLKVNLMSEILLTIIHKCYQGDTIFPLDALKEWHKDVVKKEDDFTIFRYTKPIQPKEDP